LLTSERIAATSQLPDEKEKQMKLESLERLHVPNVLTRWSTVTALVVLTTTIGVNQLIAAQQAPGSGQDGVEVLTRGPVHEAFAETITFDPEPGIVAPEAPPADIEELPPQQRPEGENLNWIPGYWAWDDERNDFLWISGIWRALPPGRQWVPGYWAQNGQVAQWTSGYWADANATEIQYLPEPPASVEEGPSVAAPSPDHHWLPGCWVWQENRYAWRPGYWATGHQDWDWVPDHYVWTPSGYVFVDGYYDYSVPRRGVVFAPVYFDGGLRTRRGFSYSPSTVINPGVFVSHLFLRPRYGHYYFGDYYGSNYADAGYSPWFSYHSSRRGYDPIYANQRWQHRRERDWERRTKDSFRNFHDNEDARPPRTWAAQRELDGRGDSSNRKRIAVAESLEELARKKDSRQRFQPVDEKERQQYGQRGQEYRRYLQQRQQFEAEATRTPGVDPATTARPARRKFSRSPFVALPADQLGKKNAPPQRHAVLKADLQVQPQPRKRSGQPGIRQAFRPGTADGPQQQDPQSGRNLRSQRQSQRQSANQDNRQGASAGQSRGQRESRGNNRQGASNAPSNDQRQDASRNQRRGESKKKDKD
jgi:WXXGXW repeat (2 copies)